MRGDCWILASIVVLGACVTEPLGDDDKLESVENAVTIDGHYLPLYRTCAGYTSGGGQRVNGLVDLELVAWTSTQHTWRAGAFAENWKRNFGWNLKRTTQLRITGTLSLVYRGQTTETWNVDIDTGGSLENHIGASHEFAPVGTELNPGSVQLQGQLTFHGRDDTDCSL